MKNEKLSKLLGGGRPVFLLIAAALLGVAMMIAGGKKTTSSDEISEYERQQANKIEQTVKALCGGRVYVIVTAEYGRETQYAKNVSQGSEQTVLSSGQPVVVRTASPVIRGISVICENGDDPALCRKITAALSTAYGVSSARICVASVRR
ncbi:MAG: hypothetical protein J6330_06750 [Clostridia bacterium]|nr:hypothetical protein [Clostridia bacterium]